MTLPVSLESKMIAVLGGTDLRAWSGSAVCGSRARCGVGQQGCSTAEATADQIPGDVVGADNVRAAAAGDIVLVAMGRSPRVARVASSGAGRKGCCGLCQPSWFRQTGRVRALYVEEGSAAQQAAAILTESVVVGAFRNVSAVLLEDMDVTSVATDVLVLGDVRDATDLVQDLASVIPGVRRLFGGRLRNAHQVEALTANLISINRRYKSHAGIRVTDVPAP